MAKEKEEKIKKETPQKEVKAKETIKKATSTKAVITKSSSKDNKNDADVNWNEDKDKDTDLFSYTDSERKKLEELYNNTLKVVNKNEIIMGKVVAITDREVVLNIGFKSDGLVNLAEFRDDPILKIDDEIEVFVVEEENEKGQLELSRKNAKLIRAWGDIVNAHEKGTIVKGKVIHKTKGGLVADVFGFETFLPGSQIDVKPIVDYDYYVGKTMEFKVVKINEAIKNAVVSHKALIESEIETQRKEIIGKLEKGQVLEGIIKNITDFGAFIDLGGLDGLLYLSDISWGRISHPNEILQLNQKINVVVLDFDNEKKRISLGLKQLQPHPWDILDPNIKEGVKVKGKVVNVEDYGAFLEIYPGIEGLVHVSEISWSVKPNNPKEYFKLGDEHEANVVTLSREERKMSLSIKQLIEDPWNEIDKKYPVGSKHKGKVINLTPYGIFLELEEGIGGLVHISDFSWTRKFTHPSEFTELNEQMEVVVMKIDTEERRLSLGQKQIDVNPWDNFESIFTVGSIHQGKILKVSDKDAVVLLPHSLEATAFIKNLKKQDGSIPKEGETLDFEIYEFDKEKRKVIVRFPSDDKKEDVSKEQAKKPHESRAKKIKKSKKPYRTSASQKSTLGDIKELSELKDKMQEPENTGIDKKAASIPSKKDVIKKDSDKDAAATQSKDKKEDKDSSQKPSDDSSKKKS